MSKVLFLFLFFFLFFFISFLHHDQHAVWTKFARVESPSASRVQFLYMDLLKSHQKLQATFQIPTVKKFRPYIWIHNCSSNSLAFSRPSTRLFQIWRLSPHGSLHCYQVLTRIIVRPNTKKWKMVSKATFFKGLLVLCTSSNWCFRFLIWQLDSLAQISVQQKHEKPNDYENSSK